MAPPNSYPDIFEFSLRETPSNLIDIPEELSDLLVKTRSEYEWPVGIGADRSQEVIKELENFVANSINDLAPDRAKSIIEKVCDWGGNNRKAQKAICRANIQEQSSMFEIIKDLKDPSLLFDCLNKLSDLSGLRLVMATKVFRFCCPDTGAALDRHASYFFNSLTIIDREGVHKPSTTFKREWSTRSHTTSRLAIYQPNSHEHNLGTFIEQYLPILKRLAQSLNAKGIRYFCEAEKTQKRWRPCDIEMAAYYWWSKNGPR